MGKTNDKFYEHSGSSGFSIPLMLLVGLPISALFAIVYAFAVAYSPFRYINFLFLGGYVVVTGLVLAYLARLGKARNANVLFLLGCLTGLFGLYFYWLFFFKALYGEDMPLKMLTTIAFNPSWLWDMICELNVNGWGGPSGIIQWILCGLEALIIPVGIGALLSGSIDRCVFCESCNQWFRSCDVRHLQFTEALAEQFEKSEEDTEFDHQAILGLPEVTEEDVPRLEAEVLECAGCDSTAVRLTLFVHQEGDGGEVALEEIDLPGILLLENRPKVVPPS